MTAEKFKAAAEQVDFVSLAERILADPERGATDASVVEIYALSCGIAQLWAITLEAELLVQALKLPTGRGEARDSKRTTIIDQQAAIVEALLGELRRVAPAQNDMGETP